MVSRWVRERHVAVCGPEQRVCKMGTGRQLFDIQFPEMLTMSGRKPPAVIYNLKWFEEMDDEGNSRFETRLRQGRSFQCEHAVLILKEVVKAWYTFI